MKIKVNFFEVFGSKLLITGILGWSPKITVIAIDVIHMRNAKRIITDIF